MFSFSLLRLNEDLLFFATFAGGLLLMVILMTHENLVGVKLSEVHATIEQTNGTMLLHIQLSNSSQSRRRRCHVTLHLANKNKITLGPLDIPGQSQITLSHRFEHGMPRRVSITRTTVFSRYPLGLLTCWMSVKFTPEWPLWLPPAPQRTSLTALRTQEATTESNHPPSGDSRANRSSAQEGEISLKHHINGPAHRIDWLRYLRTGEILIRAFEELPIATESSLLSFTWDGTSDTSRLHYAQIYSAILDAIRTHKPFRISNPQGEVLTHWDGLKETSGQSLLSFLQLGPIK